MAVEVEDGEAAGEEVVGHLTVPNRKLKLKIKINQSIREPNILICLLVLGLGAVCIIDGGVLHFSVPNPPHAHGNPSSLQNLKNEVLTSSANLIVTSLFSY